MQSGCPSNISIQDQKLDCYGELREKRYGNPDQVFMNGKPWGGVHLRGRLGARHYTISMVKVFAASFPGLLIDWNSNQSENSNFHKTCPKSAFQRKNTGHNFPRQYNKKHMFNHQSVKQSRGFKRNNFAHSNDKGRYEENIFNIPVSNRFQGNF